jgi:hypothetical protein
MQLAAPIIVSKLVRRIFDMGEEIRIGKVTFSRHGFSASGFLGGKKTVRWTDRIFAPSMIAGSVILMEDRGGRAKKFAGVPMSTPNAVVIPDLVQACCGRTH